MEHFSVNNLTIISLRLGQLDTNCYLMGDDTSGECWVIDPAADGDFINQTILETGWKPSQIIFTHGHFDHILGALEVKLAWDVPIAVHPADNFLIDSVQERAQHWLGYQVDPVPPADLELKPNQILELGSSRWQIKHTPGHTPGSICLVNDQAIFCGDLMFENGVGRTDFSYSKPLQLLESLEGLREFNLSSLVFSGHGQSFELGKALNQVLD